MRIVIAGTRRSGEDSDGPMLCGFVERDGGIVSLHVARDRSRAGLSEALAAGGTDIVVVARVLRPRRRSVANPVAVDLGNLFQAAQTAERCRAAPVLADLTGLAPARLMVGNFDPCSL
jgi:hypothetical protein